MTSVGTLILESNARVSPSRRAAQEPAYPIGFIASRLFRNDATRGNDRAIVRAVKDRGIETSATAAKPSSSTVRRRVSNKLPSNRGELLAMTKRVMRPGAAAAIH